MPSSPAPYLIVLLVTLLCSCGGKEPAPATNAAVATPVSVTGVLDAPQPGAVVTGDFPVGGWVFAKGAVLREVLVFVDGAQVSGTAAGGVRPDVAAAYPSEPGAATPGFTTKLDASQFAPGPHEVAVRATLGDGSVREFGKANITIKK